MTLIFNTFLFLQNFFCLQQYREKFNSPEIFFEKPNVERQHYIVKKKLFIEPFHNITPEIIEFYAHQWHDIIDKVVFYRLQFYNGKDRRKAITLQKNLSNQFPSILFDLEYEHANFVVKSQKYFSLIEALVICASIGYINVIITHGEELY